MRSLMLEDSRGRRTPQASLSRMRSIVSRGQDQGLGWSQLGRRNRYEQEELLMPQSNKEFKSAVSAVYSCGRQVYPLGSLAVKG